jgi:membrane associated rhomboid family serine protease
MFILPICKDNPVRNIPWTVLVLIAANTLGLVFAYVISEPNITFRQYGFIPIEHRTITLLTSVFLHSGIWHLLGNMWFLWMFGNRVENTLGRWLFVPVYLICGLGASGAISGIVGIFFVLFPKASFDLCIYIGWWQVKEIPTRTTAAVGAWIGEQAVLGLITQKFHVSSIAFWAHIGGFLTGILIAFVYVAVVPAKQRLQADLAKEWYMQDAYNRDEEHITQLKL